MRFAKLVFFLCAVYALNNVPVFAERQDDTFVTQIDALLEANGVLFIGEIHTAENHKEIYLKLFDVLVSNPQADTFAFEHGYFDNIKVLKSYFEDPKATPDSQMELYYLCKLSSDRLEVLPSFEDFLKMKLTRYELASHSEKYPCGGWQDYNFLPHSLKMFRAMRTIARTKSESDVKFCPIDRPVPDSDLFDLKAEFLKLPEDLRKLYSEKYGDDFSYDKYSPAFDMRAGAIRDLGMAANIRECFVGRKGGVVAMGGYHSQDTTFTGVTHPKEHKFSTVEALRKLFARGLGFSHYGATVLIHNHGTFDRDFLSHLRGLSDYDPYMYWISQFPENEYRVVSTQFAPARAIDLMSKFHQFDPLSKTYDYFLIAPATVNCDQTACQ